MNRRVGRERGCLGDYQGRLVSVTGGVKLRPEVHVLVKQSCEVPSKYPLNSPSGSVPNGPVPGTGFVLQSNPI